MTRVLPRKRYGQLTRLAGLLACSPHPPSRLTTVVKDWVSAFKELTAAGLRRTFTCFPFNPLLQRRIIAEQDATKVIQLN